VTFSAELRRAADPIWQAQHDHPFVRGIGDGTVDVERFKRWLRQDYRFLVEYCRVFALAAARSPDLATLRKFAQLLEATAVTEMDLHRSYAADFGISSGELEAEEMAPVTRAYTDFLVRTAATGDFAELAAALLPCMWVYSEIARALGKGPRPAQSWLAAWIDSYADPEFAALAAWCRDLVDRLGTSASKATQDAMESAFMTSSRYELAFWGMSWQLERWPL